MVQEKDEFARGMFTVRSNSRPTIAFLTHSLSDSYGALLWEGVMEAAKKGGANLICFPGWALDDRRGFNAQANIIYELVSERNVDGLVISSGTLGNYVGVEKFRQFCEQYYPLPMASIAVELEGIPSIFIENRHCMFEVVTHLIEEHQLTRIVFISGQEKSAEAKERYLGFQDAMEKHGLTPVFVTPYAEWEEVAGVNAINMLLDEQKLVPGKDLQAVVTGSDNVAIGVLAELRKRGVRVPEDIALTGFDGQENTKYLTPRLTTVRQPIREQGYLASQWVLDQIKGEKVENERILTTGLEIRQSCGCPHVEAMLAKADNTARLRNIPRMARALSWKNVLPKMIVAIADSPTSIAKEQMERVLNAFSAELREEPSEGFLTALRNVLRQAALADKDVFAWQEAISVMRRDIWPLIEEDYILSRAEDLWQQARVIIGERAQRMEGYRRLVAEQRQATLDGINRELVSASNTNELMDILAKELPKLEIPGCYVSLYENPVVPTNGCRLILACSEGCVEPEAREKHFLSWQLIPPDLLPQDRLYNLIVEPLYFRENQIGLAVFEAGPRHGAIYETLRGQLSSALWSSRLVQYLHSLYEASSTIMSLQEPKDILQDVVERVCRAVGAKWANVVILDKEGRPRRLSMESDLSNTIHSSILIGTASMVAQVMQSNEPILIDDIRGLPGPATQQMIELGIGAAGCFPLRLRDKPIGAMWVYYENTHHFPGAEVSALRLYVNQAAIAYDNARRMKELEHLRQAAERLAGVAEVKEVLQQIVKSAREVLQADSTVIWSYDLAREIFLPSELVADGVASEVLEKFRKDQPSPNGTAAIVIMRGYLAVTNIENSEFHYLEVPAHRLRNAIGVKSFQGIALQVEDEPLGVLYVNYKQQRGFDEEDEATLKAFAYHAALALKKARLLERLKKVHDAARIVAEASVLKNLQGILDAIAKGTEDALGCDAVTLYTYDETRDKIGFPPAMVGVKETGEVLKYDYVARNSIIYNILERDEMHVTEDMLSDPIMGRRPFVKREDIKSSVSLPLRVGKHKVGVMFVNYRASRHFTNEELADIELFAHQAAVAIRNAQLYNETTKRAAYLETFYEASKAFTGTLALDEILNRIAEQAWLFTGRLGEHARFADLAMVEGNRLSIKAAYPLKWVPELQARVAEINLDKDTNIGITGRAVKSGKSLLVDDVINNPDYTEGDSKTRSELAVPIKIGEEVIGVVNVEHPDIKVFDEEDQRTLEALAAQAAIAIENARLFKETEHRALLLATASEVARDATAILDIKQLLDQTVLLISERFGFYHAGIFLIDKGDGYAVLKAASSDGGRRMLEHGYKLKIGEVGIVGHVASSGRPRIALDVGKDAYFFNNLYLPSTRSEIAIPMYVHNQLIGVLDVQSIESNAFAQEHKVVLQIMADQLVIAIENAQQYEELKRTQGLVGSRTALAWMGMASNAWRHEIDKHALSISGQIHLLESDLTVMVPRDNHPGVYERLSMIQRLAKQIKAKPITPPLSGEELVASVSINVLIRERIKQLSENEPYKSIRFQKNLALDDRKTIRISSEWLRRALDILIDNGIEAMADTTRQEMTIETVQEDNQMVMRITDTGKGIPEDVRMHLFIDPIHKAQGSKGLGMGLLMAQVIIQTYGGEVGVESTSSSGTTIFVRLPLEA